MARNDRPSNAKKSEGFNTPFKGIKSALKKAEPAPAPPRPAPAPARRPPPKPSPAASSEAADAELFMQAVAGTSRIVDRTGVAPPPPPRPAHVTDDEAEGLAHLADLVSGEGPFDIADTDEYIEGAAPGVDKRLLAALRRGDYAVQGHLDLHGMTKADAKEAVDRFLTESRRDGHRCVLLVHGRGLNSKDHIPVLKEQLNVWLRRGRIGKAVLAFATARPHDGGAGALYVLLRR